MGFLLVVLVSLVSCVAGQDVVHDWVKAVEGTECFNIGPITCVMDNGFSPPRRHFKFPKGEFVVSRQANVPENTVIEGVANPNDVNDKTKRPEYSEQTVFVADGGVDSSDACYCQNLLRSWEPESEANPLYCQDLTVEQVRGYRKGFLMATNTMVKNIAFQGKDTLRPNDNGALCGGGVFETPGCVHNQCDPRFAHLVTGDGRPVSNVWIENVRLNDYSYGPLASQLAVWTAQTSHIDRPTHDVTVKNLVAMLLHADGINFHGFVQNAVVDDCYIQNTGDDIFAVWAGHFDTRGIVFQNSIGVDAGRDRDNHYGSCVAVYGAQEATFQNLQCFAPEQNTHDCFDPEGKGETCNGCLGIIKNSFGADYSSSVFTFANNNFYKVKSNGQGYDLTNPEPNGRPEVCNNQWTTGGLTINSGKPLV